MQDEVYPMIDTPSYLRLLDSMFPSVEDIVLCDPAGEVIAESGEQVGAEFNILVAQNRFYPCSDAAGEQFLLAEEPGGRFCYKLEVISAVGEKIATIGMFFEEEIVDNDQLFEKLQTAASRFCVEYELTCELNAMASELTGRYEELNLVYAAEEEAENTAHDEDALAPILDSCVEHLDVGLVVLVMPEKEVSLFSVNPRDPIGEVSRLIPMLTGGFYEWVKLAGEGVVINAITDRHRIKYCPEIPYKLLACPVFDANKSVVGLLVTMNRTHRPDFFNSDRSLLMALAKKVSKLVQVKYDTLTGLIQRRGFEARLSESISRSMQSAVTHSVLSVDIDNLQIVNDTTSHDAGDAVIKTVSSRLEKNIRTGDQIGYLGRGKFAVLLERCPLQQGQQIAENLRAAVHRTGLQYYDKSIDTSITIGIVQVSSDTESPSAAMDAADIALDAAKELGRNRVHSFVDEDVEITRRKDQMKWVSRIQDALKNNRFELYCQFIVPSHDLNDRSHFEVLLRLLDKEGNPVSPGEFIPAAERYQLMPSVDRWVVSSTLALLAELHLEQHWADYVCAINLSGQSLADAGFTEFVISELEQHKVPAKNVCFEITETAAIGDLDAAKDFITTIQGKGCSFSLDDFGTGLSSFAYLKMLPVDYLKIDGSFVRQVNDDPIAEAMVAAINQVGHVMGLKTIAEYVESESIGKRIAAMGVDFLQGYALSKPEPMKSVLTRVISSQHKAG